MNETENQTNQTTEAAGSENNAPNRPNLEIPSVARRPAAPNMNPFAMGGFGTQPHQPANAAQSSMSGMSNSTSGMGMVGHNSEEDSRKLVIGAGITISGEINSCDYLVVEGKVKSEFKSSNRLDISETGDFTGSADVQEATIAGNFEGTLTVAGRLTVRSTANITGTIFYGELAVEGGAVIEGKISTIARKSDASAPKAKKADKQDSKKEGDNVAQMQLATG